MTLSIISSRHAQGIALNALQTLHRERHCAVFSHWLSMLHSGGSEVERPLASAVRDVLNGMGTDPSIQTHQSRLFSPPPLAKCLTLNRLMKSEWLKPPRFCLSDLKNEAERGKRKSSCPAPRPLSRALEIQGLPPSSKFCKFVSLHRTPWSRFPTFTRGGSDRFNKRPEPTPWRGPIQRVCAKAAPDLALALIPH